jgi:hypothetical protein
MISSNSPNSSASPASNKMPEWQLQRAADEDIRHLRPHDGHEASRGRLQIERIAWRQRSVRMIAGDHDHAQPGTVAGLHLLRGGSPGPSRPHRCRPCSTLTQGFQAQASTRRLRSAMSFCARSNICRTAASNGSKASPFIQPVHPN